MRYRIKEHVNEGYKVEKKNERYHIFEIATKQYIMDYASSKEAKNVTRQYKLGAGFNGWTPPFITGAPGAVVNYSNADIDDEYLDVD